MPFQAVVFDLDGTLLDTIEDLSDSMNAVLSQMGFPARTIAEYKLFVGDGIEKLVLRSLPEGQDSFLKEALSLMYYEYSRRWSIKTKLYNGIPELLAEISRKGLKKAVLSNKPDEFTQEAIKRFFPEFHFDFVLGEKKGNAKKPDPAGAIEISKNLGIPAAEFVYLGDTAVDMLTAASAGMFPVGALWGFRSAEELLKGGAKRLVEKPMDLLELL
jgi:phosphoglycolate phosphatase